MRWLITGGCGFIGRNLVRRLHEGGHAVRALDNLAVGRREDLAYAGQFQERTLATLDCTWPDTGIELVVADIIQPGAVLAATQGADVVVHLAANSGVERSIGDPAADCTTNVLGTLSCLEAARHASVRRFLFASSGAPMGASEPPHHEAKVPKPISPYGASKLAGEGYCSAYFHSFGVEAVALRFGNVYGPGSSHKTSLVARLIRRALAGEPLEVFGDGSQTRDFIYIDDLLEAIAKAAAIPGIGGETFQIATASETTVAEVASRLAAMLAQAGLSDVRICRAAPRLGDMPRNFADTAKARQRLAWRPAVPLNEGLARTVRWFLETQAA